MGRTAHRRAAGRAAPTPPLLERIRPNTASAITAIVLALGDAARAAAGSCSEGQQGSGTHLAGQVAVAGDGSLVNIGKARKRAKKDTGSSVSVQDTARRVRDQ
jgi:hypothetical protein